MAIDFSDTELLLYLWMITGILMYAVCLILVKIYSGFDFGHFKADLLFFFLFLLLGPASLPILIIILVGVLSDKSIRTARIIKKFVRDCKRFYYQKVIPFEKIPLYLNQTKDQEMKQVLLDRLQGEP